MFALLIVVEKTLKSRDENVFNQFVELLRPLFLQVFLTDAIKMSPYAKYMKDIVFQEKNT